MAIDLSAGEFDLTEMVLSEARYMEDQQAQAFEFYDNHNCDCRMASCYDCKGRLEAEDEDEGDEPYDTEDEHDDGDGPHMELQENMDFAQDGDFENYYEE